MISDVGFMISSGVRIYIKLKTVLDLRKSYIINPESKIYLR